MLSEPSTTIEVTRLRPQLRNLTVHIDESKQIDMTSTKAVKEAIDTFIFRCDPTGQDWTEKKEKWKKVLNDQNIKFVDSICYE